MKPALKLVLTNYDPLELLEWTYGRQKAHLMPDRPDRPGYASNSGQWGRSEALGVVITPGGGGHKVHADADLVHDFVMKFGQDLRDLLIYHGKAGSKPDGAVGMRPKLLPLWNNGPRFNHRGQPAKGSFKLNLKNKKSHSCPLVVINGPVLIGYLRRDYMLWWNGLTAIYEHFAEYPLTTVTLCPLQISQCPWED